MSAWVPDKVKCLKQGDIIIRSEYNYVSLGLSWAECYVVIETDYCDKNEYLMDMYDPVYEFKTAGKSKWTVSFGVIAYGLFEKKNHKIYPYEDMDINMLLKIKRSHNEYLDSDEDEDSEIDVRFDAEVLVNNKIKNYIVIDNIEEKTLHTTQKMFVPVVKEYKELVESYHEYIPWLDLKVELKAMSTTNDKILFDVS